MGQADRRRPVAERDATHMRVAGRDDDPPGPQPQPVGRDLARAIADHRELRGEIGHERGRQMLRDQDRQAEGRRDLCEQRAERVDAAGRRADRHHVIFVGGGSGAWHRHGGGAHRHDGGHRPVFAGDADQPVELVDEDLAELPQPLAARRLEDGVGRAQRQRLHGGRGALAGLAGDDEHVRPLPRRNQAGQGGQTVDAGHLHVEQHELDALAGEHRQCRGRGADAGDHHIAVGRSDDPLHHRARHRRIIDDEHAGGRSATRCGVRLVEGMDGGGHGRAPARQAMPTIWSFDSSVSRSNGFITYSSAPASIAARI
jgi:hypothetical protein